MTRRVLLIGGGHAHIEVVRRWGTPPIDEVTLTVIDPSSRPIYSGMVPGFVAGPCAPTVASLGLDHGMSAPQLKPDNHPHTHPTP